MHPSAPQDGRVLQSLSTTNIQQKTYMRKTLSIISALAASVAFADTADQIIAFGNAETNLGENVWVVTNEGASNFNATQGTATVSGAASSGLFWHDSNITFSNVNASAKAEWESYTSLSLSSITVGVNPGGGSANFTDFTITDSKLTAGEQFTLYLTVGSQTGGTVSVGDILGLTNVGIYVAGASDSSTAWMDTTSTSNLTAHDSTIIKITGELTGSTVSMDLTGGNKPIISTAAYGATPEPTTATLSLLALAGLCIRRRRK